jgi:hypothetical protein
MLPLGGIGSGGIIAVAVSLGVEAVVLRDAETRG